MADGCKAMAERKVQKGGRGMTREQFTGLPDMAADIKKRAAQVQRLRIRVTSPKGLDTREKVQSSGGTNNMADVLIDMTADLDALTCQYNDLKAEAADLIDAKLSEYPELILLATLRYLNNSKWSDITAVLGYSPATVYRMNDQTIDIIFN